MARKSEQELSYKTLMARNSLDGLFNGLVDQLSASLPPSLTRHRFELAIRKLQEDIVSALEKEG